SLSGTVVKPAVTQGLSALVAGSVQASLTDPTGHQTLWQLDSAGRPLVQVAADGGTTQWTRDATTTWVSKVTDPLNQVTTITRDAQGYETQEVLPDGNSQSWAYKNDGFHSLGTYTNERGYNVTYTYDASGHRLTETNALGQTTSYTYTSGLVETVTDP